MVLNLIGVLVMSLMAMTIGATTLPNDTFDGTVIDNNKWEVYADGGATVTQNDKLIVSTSKDYLISKGNVTSRWEFLRDFDVQVDWNIEQGWGNWLRVTQNDHLDGAVMGVSINDRSYHLTRIRFPEGYEGILLWAPSEGGWVAFRVVRAMQGQFRIARSGVSLSFMYKIDPKDLIVDRQQEHSLLVELLKTGIITGQEFGKLNEELMKSYNERLKESKRGHWQPIGKSIVVSDSSAKLYLYAGSIDTYHVFVTSFDNFYINLGLTTYGK